MQIQSELCHIEGNRTIVRVSIWNGEKNLGSTLSEGSTVEIAEEKAVRRLLERISIKNGKKDEADNKVQGSNYTQPVVNQQTITNKLSSDDSQQIRSSDTDPEEWSKELAEIEIEIKRLEWNRDDECIYLRKHFGFNDRNRITSFTDLIKYLKALKNIPSSSSNNLSGESDEKILLMNKIDSNIKQLGWTTSAAREFLFKNMNVTSRQALSGSQLVEFNRLICLQLTNEAGNTI